MDKSLRERLDKIEEIVRNLPQPTELLRRTYVIGKTRTKRIFHPYPSRCPFDAEYY